MGGVEWWMLVSSKDLMMTKCSNGPEGIIARLKIHGKGERRSWCIRKKNRRKPIFQPFLIVVPCMIISKTKTASAVQAFNVVGKDKPIYPSYGQLVTEICYVLATDVYLSYKKVLYCSRQYKKLIVKILPMALYIGFIVSYRIVFKLSLDVNTNCVNWRLFILLWK